MKRLIGKSVVLAGLLFSMSYASAQEKSAPSKLDLSNFFSEGWSEPWVKRPNPNGAPDMALLRVQTNFLWRDFQIDAFSQQNLASKTGKNVQFVDSGVVYPLNRRFMVLLLSNYQWNDSRVNENRSGASVTAGGRFQLVDVPGASYALNLKVVTPNEGIGDSRTTASYALAGWHDLTPLGLYRTGLYFHVQHEINIGPHSKGAKQNDLTYDLSLAKSWTKPGGFFGNFSTFVEAYSATYLDGSNYGHTATSITPGARFTIHGRHTLMAGVEIPVTHPVSCDQTFRFTYFYNF